MSAWNHANYSPVKRDRPANKNAKKYLINTHKFSLPSIKIIRKDLIWRSRTYQPLGKDKEKIDKDGFMTCSEFLSSNI